MLKINPKEMLCAFPAGVAECQCPSFTVAASEKMDVCPRDTRAFDPPPSPPILLVFNKYQDKEKTKEKSFLSTFQTKGTF